MIMNCMSDILGASDIISTIAIDCMLIMSYVSCSQ